MPKPNISFPTLGHVIDSDSRTVFPCQMHTVLSSQSSLVSSITSLSCSCCHVRESTRIIYDNAPETDRILQDVIVQRASKNINRLLDCGEFVDLLKSHSNFAAEVLRRVVSNFESLTEI